MRTENPAAERTNGSWRLRFREAALPAMAGAAVLAASLINFLNHNQYPILRPEIGLLAAALLIGVLVMAILYAHSGRIVRMVLQILLVCVALDLNFDGLVVPIAAVGIAMLLQRHAMPFVAVAASVVLVTTLAGMAIAEGSGDERTLPSAAGRQDDLPVLVHLVLDEHIGIEGLRGGTSNADAMADELKRLYLTRGFRLFGGAYSEHIRTMNALPSLFNFGAEQPWDPANRRRSALASNLYFDRLGEMGYRISVSQTNYMDFCKNGFVERCRTRHATEIAAVADAPLSTVEKAEIVANEFAVLSYVLYGPARIYRELRYDRPVHAVPPFGQLKAFDRLAEDLQRAQPGSAFFMHELLPHTPYMLDRDCRLKDRSAWRDHAGGLWATRVDAYVDQIACLNRKVAAILEAAGPNAIIVVHGDHGSRITDVEPNVATIGEFDDRDLLAGHSTLFAVRAPDIEAGYDARALPIAEILRALAASDFRSAEVSLPSDFAPSVVLEEEEWKPGARYPLPKNWPAGAAH